MCFGVQCPVMSMMICTSVICVRVCFGVHVYGGLYICGGVQVEEDDKQVLVTRERQRACWLGVR